MRSGKNLLETASQLIKYGEGEGLIVLRSIAKRIMQAVGTSISAISQ
jgi:hypothetical protein